MASAAAGTLFRCPRCHDTLDGDDSDYRCPAGHRYLERDGVLDLVSSDDDEAWEAWDRHLAAFSRRREARARHPRRVASLVARRRGQHAAFRTFVHLAGDVVLDIGCGPGRFKAHLGPDVRYVGVDPIVVLPDATSFEFARAVSEALPFADETFSDVVVLNALDHVRDVSGTLREIRRVLVPGGRLHVLQTVHDRRDLLRWLAHEAKERLEVRGDPEHDGRTPHHMTEFTPTGLREALGDHLRIVREGRWARTALAPWRMMVTAEKPELRSARSVGAAGQGAATEPADTRL